MNKLFIKIFIAKPGKKYFPYWESVNIMAIFALALIIIIKLISK